MKVASLFLLAFLGLITQGQGQGQEHGQPDQKPPLPLFAMLARGADVETLRTLALFRRFMLKVGDDVLEGAHKQRVDDKIHVFQADVACNCTFTYSDEQGKMKGFAIDLVEEVCKEAGKKCVIQYSPFTDCINDHHGLEHLSAGAGLLGRNFDACSLVAHSKELERVMSFSDSYWDYSGESQFFVKKGNPNGFDANDITGKKIGFIRGVQSNQQCLQRHNVAGSDKMTDEQIVYLENILDIRPFLEENKVDAVFALELPQGTHEDHRLEMIGGTPSNAQSIGPLMNCASGFHVAARKDSQLLDWFNDGLRAIKKSGKYALLCKRATVEHGHMGPINCLFD